MKSRCHPLELKQNLECDIPMIIYITISIMSNIIKYKQHQRCSDDKNKESIFILHTHTHTHTHTALYPQQRIQQIAALDLIWH